jgi:hypothetical protein
LRKKKKHIFSQYHKKFPQILFKLLFKMISFFSL